MKKPDISGSAWVQRMAKAAFPLYQAIHAFNLHFNPKADYDYPGYGGRTSLTLKGFTERHARDLPALNRLNTYLNANGISAEHFLFANRIGDVKQLFELNMGIAQENYRYWDTCYSTKELYEKHVSYILEDRFGRLTAESCMAGDLATCRDVVDDYCLDCFSGNNYPAHCDRLHACIFLLGKIGKEDVAQLKECSVLAEISLNKIEKFKAFTDYFCIT